MIKVLVDSGSTKSDWLVLNGSEPILQFELAGLNPMTQSKSSLLSQIEMAKNKLQSIHPESIIFYGAGCKDLAAQIIETLLKDLFPSCLVQVHSDLLAAARANCAGKEGIVCIMGTGSHSCLSDGHQIIHEKPSLGYLLDVYKRQDHNLEACVGVEKDFFVAPGSGEKFEWTIDGVIVGGDQHKMKHKFLQSGNFEICVSVYRLSAGGIRYGTPDKECSIVHVFTPEDQAGADRFLCCLLYTSRCV